MKHIHHYCKTIITATALCIILASCHTAGDNSGSAAIEIAVTPTEGVLRMSSLYDGYEMIVPEGIVISGIADVAVTDSMLIVLGNTDSGLVSVFDRSGRYERSFLMRGRGPQEMTDVTAMAYNSVDGTVDVLGNYGMDVYRFDPATGEMTGSFSIEGSEMTCARDLLPTGDGRYLFYKDLPYIDEPEYEVYLYNPASGEFEGKWLPMDKEFADAVGFAQANNLFEYGGRYFFYSAFLDGVYEFTGDTLVQYIRYADNGFNFTEQTKKTVFSPDLMEFVENCKKSGRMWGNVDMYMIGGRTLSVYNYGDGDRYALVMEPEKTRSTSYNLFEDDMVWGITSDSFFSPYYLRYTDGQYAVYLVEPFDVMEKAENCPTDDPAILSNREKVRQLPYESNQIILLMNIRK